MNASPCDGTMPMLPEDENNRKEIRERFAHEFQIAAEILQCGLIVMRELRDMEESPVEQQTRTLIGSMVVRELRKFRSIMHLLEYCQCESAEILLRSLFEGILAERFILATPIPLDQCSPQLRGTRKNLEAKPPQTWTADFRGTLVAAAAALQAANTFPGGLAEAAMSKEEAAATRENHRSAVALTRQKVGDDWVDVIQTRKQYSGMTVRNLAENYGLLSCYGEIYFFQSLEVHSALPLRHVNIQGKKVKFIMGGKTEDAPAVFRFAIAILGMLLNDIGDFFGLQAHLKLGDMIAVLPQLDIKRN